MEIVRATCTSMDKINIQWNKLPEKEEKRQKLVEENSLLIYIGIEPNATTLFEKFVCSRQTEHHVLKSRIRSFEHLKLLRMSGLSILDVCTEISVAISVAIVICK